MMRCDTRVVSESSTNRIFLAMKSFSRLAGIRSWFRPDLPPGVFPKWAQPSKRVWYQYHFGIWPDNGTTGLEMEGESFWIIGRHFSSMRPCTRILDVFSVESMICPVG